MISQFRIDGIKRGKVKKFKKITQRFYIFRKLKHTVFETYN